MGPDETLFKARPRAAAESFDAGSQGREPVAGPQAEHSAVLGKLKLSPVWPVPEMNGLRLWLGTLQANHKSVGIQDQVLLFIAARTWYAPGRPAWTNFTTSELIDEIGYFGIQNTRFYVRDLIKRRMVDAKPVSDNGRPTRSFQLTPENWLSAPKYRAPFVYTSDWRWRWLRQYILRKAPFCRTCNASGTKTRARDIDHIVPVSHGGARLDISNLQPLCTACHKLKSAEQFKADRGGIYVGKPLPPLPPGAVKHPPMIFIDPAASEVKN